MNSLEAAIVDQPGLDGTVELSVSGTPVTEFVRGLGVTHQLNITIDPAVKGEVVNNFTNARVVDVLMFLCKRYDLDVEFIGSIIVLKPFVPEAPPEEPPPPPRTLSITYDADSALVDMDLRRDTLSAVARTISQNTGANVVLAPGLENKLVSVFIQRATLPSAMEKLAFANSLTVERTKDGTYQLRGEVEASPKQTDRNARGTPGATAGNFEVALRDGDRVVVDAHNIPMEQIISKASTLLDQDFFLYDAMDRSTTLHLSSVSSRVVGPPVEGTEFTHRVSEGIHLIGKRDLEGLRATEIVRLHHRPVKDVLAAIPEGIKKNITISEFVELNGIVLSGDALRIEEVKTFLRTIDQVVPVVMIEVMLVDVNRSHPIYRYQSGLGRRADHDRRYRPSGSGLQPEQFLHQ
ncbi:MAG: hypothetical protein IPO56_16155 [Flavobacteriales bacterium]|nr:hypothetical protein [Flavobacteriales bacterium]